MKLLSVLTAEGPSLAAKLASGILVFAQAGQLVPKGELALPLTLEDALLAHQGLDSLLPRIKAVLQHPRVSEFVVADDSLTVTKPFQPRNVICVGLNYRDHAEEGGTAPPERPMLFSKCVSAIIGPGDAIVLPEDSAEVDYEAELAVIIGRTCRNVTMEAALDCVAGYSCMNDVSARDFQRADGQWMRAKSQDTFGPFGPYIVTKDEIQDPQTLAIRCSVNGRVLQNSNTSKMIFGVKELIAFITRGMTLRAGDVISTGTPHGVGFAQKPPVFLLNGDTVVVEIDGIGNLSNPVMS